MTAHPLLALPSPRPSSPPPSRGGGGALRTPTRQRQIDTFGPTFDRVRLMLARQDGAASLRDDPDCLAPERVIVFEVAGVVDNFRRAVAKVKGLEFLLSLRRRFNLMPTLH
jgi:hypothetical protein